jgi:hypothetical protein
VDVVHHIPHSTPTHKHFAGAQPYKKLMMNIITVQINMARQRRCSRCWGEFIHFHSNYLKKERKKNLINISHLPTNFFFCFVPPTPKK